MSPFCPHPSSGKTTHTEGSPLRTLRRLRARSRGNKARQAASSLVIRAVYNSCLEESFCSFLPDRCAPQGDVTSPAFNPNSISTDVCLPLSSSLSAHSLLLIIIIIISPLHRVTTQLVSASCNSREALHTGHSIKTDP